MLAAHFQALDEATTRRASIVLRRAPIPTLDGKPMGTVIIKAVASSICGSDLSGGGGCGCDPSWRKPIDHYDSLRGCVGGTGHEVIGEVAAVVPPCALAVGTRVLALVTSYINAVPSMAERFRARTGRNPAELPPQGAWMPWFLSHDCACLPLPTAPPPAGFDPLWFVAAQPLGTIIHAVKKMGCVLGQTICVLGQGQNGLLLTQMLSRAGAKRIVCLDLLPNRCGDHALIAHVRPSPASRLAHVTSPHRAPDGASLKA